MALIGEYLMKNSDQVQQNRPLHQGEGSKQLGFTDDPLESLNASGRPGNRHGPPEPSPGKPGKPPGSPNPPGRPKEPPGKPEHPPGNPDRPGPPGDPPGRGQPPPRRVKPQPTFGESTSAWWLQNAERWEYERSRMEEYYSGWRLEGCHPHPKDPHQMVPPIWIGDISPLHPPSDAVGVINALAANEEVEVYLNGRVDVDPNNPPRSMLQPIVDEAMAQRTFSLIARQEGPPRHPRVFVMVPELPQTCPHLFSDRSLCPLLPSTGAWSWNEHSLADYLDHVAIWLVKFIVWDAIRKATGQGIWIGHEASHDWASLAKTPSSAQCYCGSGLQFRECCARTECIGYVHRA